MAFNRTVRISLTKLFIFITPISLCWQIHYKVMSDGFIVASFVVLLSIASDEMRVIRKDKISVTLGYNRDPGAGRYEIYLLNPNSKRRAAPCNIDECSFTDMQPGTTYTIWLGTCSGRNPVRCVGRAKPLVVTSATDGKPVCLGYFSQIILKSSLKRSFRHRSRCY